MSDEILSSRDTQGAGAAHRGPDPLVTGKRVLLALGLWLLAAVVVGAATVFAARSSDPAAVTAIVVAEVYTLLMVALTIVFRPRTAQALGLVRCRGPDVGLGRLRARRRGWTRSTTGEPDGASSGVFGLPWQQAERPVSLSVGGQPTSTR